MTELGDVVARVGRAVQKLRRQGRGRCPLRGSSRSVDGASRRSGCSDYMEQELSPDELVDD